MEKEIDKRIIYSRYRPTNTFKFGQGIQQGLTIKESELIAHIKSGIEYYIYNPTTEELQLIEYEHNLYYGECLNSWRVPNNRLYNLLDEIDYIK